MLFRSPAKINLYLRVGPRRADGFHSLVSWFCSVGLYDQLEFTPNSSGAITLSCDVPGVPTDERNLVMRAAKAVDALCNGRGSMHIALQKSIPMGGGLGGGSSNAGITLRTLAMLWNVGAPGERLHAIGAELGSDVPFFLHLPSALCRGRGEQVQRIAAPVPKAVVLILPPIAMPTPQVYRRFDEMGLGTDLEAVEQTLPDPSLPAAELLKTLTNDLEAPAFALSPKLGQLRQACEQTATRPVRMSGSGSTLFTLYDDPAEAHAAAERIASAHGIKALACELGVLP